MKQNMEKRYGLPTAICMVVGIVIGSGIFFKTEDILRATGGNVLSGVLSLLIMGVIMLFCAYAFSILAHKYEKVNGVLDYAEAACGPKYAYYLGWFMTFIYTPGIASVLCWVTARYLGALFGLSATGGETMLLASLILFAVAFLNAVSPKIAGKLQVSTTAIKLVPLVLMAIVGTASGLSNGQLAANFTKETASDISFFGGMMKSIVALAFAFEGWILATSINAELKNAKKTLPLALILGGTLIVAVFVCYYLGICGAVSVEDLMKSDSTQAFINLFGNTMGTILSVFIVISCLGTTNGLLMATSRNMYSLAARGHGPKPSFFARVDEDTNMPVNSAFVGALIVMAWIVYFYGANLVEKPWFGMFSFDSSELVIVAIYLMYIPIFAKMYTHKEDNFFKRFIVPSLAIFSSIVLIACAVYSHGIAKYQAAAAEGKFAFPVLFFGIVTVVVLIVGGFFYHPEAENGNK